MLRWYRTDANQRLFLSIQLKNGTFCFLFAHFGCCENVKSLLLNNSEQFCSAVESDLFGLATGNQVLLLVLYPTSHIFSNRDMPRISVALEF